jgi:hypothetical protein
LQFAGKFTLAHISCLSLTKYLQIYRWYYNYDCIKSKGSAFLEWICLVVRNHNGCRPRKVGSGTMVRIWWRSHCTGNVHLGLITNIASDSCAVKYGQP